MILLVSNVSKKPPSAKLQGRVHEAMGEEVHNRQLDAFQKIKKFKGK
jgi:hypothetical protein